MTNFKSAILLIGIVAIAIATAGLRSSNIAIAQETKTYDCTNPYYNDDRLPDCTDCEERCSGSITFNACYSWCEGNNYCKGCEAESDNSEVDSTTKDSANDQTYVIIQSVKGDVQVSFQDTEYVTAEVGMKLQAGDYISTGFESEAVIQVQDVGYATVKEMTDFAISQFSIENDIAKVIFRLQQGSMHSVIQPERRIKANFEIITPTSTVGVRGTIFTLDYDPDLNNTTLSVEKGEVLFSDINGKNEITVYTGETYSMDEYGQTQKLKDIDTSATLIIGFLIFLVIGIPLSIVSIVLFKKKKKVLGCIVSTLLFGLVVLGMIFALLVLLI